MKLRVVHDEEGQIVAGIFVDGRDEISFQPVAGVGETAAEVEVPAGYAGEDLEKLCTQFRVEGGRLLPLDDAAAD